MTQYHFISSPIILKEGSFGENAISPNVYENELDFTHVYMERNYDPEEKKFFSFSKHFKYKYQVSMVSTQVPLKGEKRITPEGEKCLKILYEYIREAVNESGVIEFFASWNSEEDYPIREKRQITLTDLKTPRDLIIADREFVTIYKDVR
ncbi:MULTISPECIES: hypothetical protein [Bacillaceae]|uniref:Uncharacterized protein n=1 Tax=Gottfriedia luciferensis TaxID=178774 RepID=A0ABX2ZSQ7_9BACI|nr:MULTISPECIES: hypothetical protein [Bacillaceae]ODG91494.1 hypothetical protein BED47_07520 [Gottfriedia luciferensis]PGZ92158.1 hypothetical protein COE53_12395 [Bacillus sp. AFS029533]